MTEKTEVHIEIYEDRSVLYHLNGSSTYREGVQSEEARRRYEKIKEKLDEGFLEDVLEKVQREGFSDTLSGEDKEILLKFADAVTSNSGRGLVALGVQQFAIKAICPEQSVRLHKAGKNKKDFSWQEGISMRSIDSAYVAPFLRQYDLLRLNKDGAFMTRTLAENYPFSKLYKAKIQGPRAQWLELVDRLESGTIDPLAALEFILAFLQNKSDAFNAKCREALGALNSANGVTLDKVERAVKSFLQNTEYTARAFEISLHSFMQALIDMGYAKNDLEPLSQMRSANKKHGNIGDIERKDGSDILESWDAKYRKPYLIDELSELEDKLETAPRVMTAGFVCDLQPEIKNDVKEKMADIETEFDTEVKILSLHDWIGYQIELTNVSDRDALGAAWLVALTESLTLQRPQCAPIDEPCETWVEDLTKVIKRSFK